MKHLNVKITFLNGDIQEQVYMIQPQGFVDFGHENKVCLLMKAIHTHELTLCYKPIDSYAMSLITICIFTVIMGNTPF